MTINKKSNKKNTSTAETDNETPGKAVKKKSTRQTLDKTTDRKIKALEKKISVLEEKLSVCEDKKNAAEEKMLRVVADYENSKRRNEREAARSLEFAKDRVLIGLFPIIDNLERSVQHEETNSENDGQVQGVQLVLDQIKKYLKDTGDVECFDPLGEKFNPDEHEALATRPDAKEDSGLVIEVFEKGYRSKDRILRPAKVVVSE